MFFSESEIQSSRESVSASLPRERWMIELALQAWESSVGLSQYLGRGGRRGRNHRYVFQLL